MRKIVPAFLGMRSKWALATGAPMVKSLFRLAACFVSVAAIITPPFSTNAREQRAALPRLVDGELYKIARKHLIKLGYEPIPFRPNRVKDGCETFPDVCKAYPEVEMCYVTGNSACIFFWKDKKGAPFLISTRTGENIKLLNVSGPFQPRDLELNYLKENTIHIRER